jgi:DNA helicase-2/ATP-dependent DNA helicase PcrA
MQKTRFKKENPPEVDLESVLQPGAKVKHAVFGTGTVLSADLDRQCYTVHFESLKTKRTLSMNAKLEKL